MKKILISVITILLIMSLNVVFATSNTNNTNTKEIISNDTKSQLVNLKKSQLESLKDYNDIYGNNIYGTVAYILNKIRLYSIPIAILGIAISAIYKFVLGNRHLEAKTKGTNGMIAIITFFIICQVLPLVFAIVVKGWRG